MNRPVIRLERLGKQYRIGHARGARTLREDLVEMARRPSRGRITPPTSTVWALREVSLEVERGEVVGIIGGNGAGKSTLLKILSRVVSPTEGWAEIVGRVGSLLEAGTGFHSELTGRENVYMSGAILGMRKAEIDRKFDEIVGVRGYRAVPRHAGQAILERHAGPARIRRGGAPRARGLDRGRGAGGRRHGVPEEVPGPDAGRRPGRRADGALREPQHGRGAAALQSRRPARAWTRGCGRPDG